MPTQSALTLVNALAESALRVGPGASNYALRAQAAFVRSITDEIRRHHPSDRWVAPLHEQLGEELARLAELLGASSGAGAPAREDLLQEVPPVDVLVVEGDDGSRRAAISASNGFGYDMPEIRDWSWRANGEERSAR